MLINDLHISTLLLSIIYNDLITLEESYKNVTKFLCLGRIFYTVIFIIITMFTFLYPTKCTSVLIVFVIVLRWILIEMP